MEETLIAMHYFMPQGLLKTRNIECLWSSLAGIDYASTVNPVEAAVERPMFRFLAGSHERTQTIAAPWHRSTFGARRASALQVLFVKFYPFCRNDITRKRCGTSGEKQADQGISHDHSISIKSVSEQSLTALL